ncbi:hypothetical protein [Bdellovibrio reynosensis]|uniref:Uncharacterized protein n=1 Tax=Bdellovibrio reynosensis TaxID=2835041 RepID=A0ABY4C5I3_9BACT|nr:hypothetical protein [Bdellovibrio reynosensis]UOF00153.1 hypothetical protein MNR06_10610 [Bdellovibrio reynosensis]
MMKNKPPLQKMSRFISLILILATLPFAVMLLNKKISQSRGIATDQVGYQEDLNYDLSEASVSEFKKAFKYQLLKNILVEKNLEGVVITVGGFQMKDSAGNKVSVCELYPTIDFFLSAEGVAFSGEIPQLIVRASCVPSTDHKHISSFPIPFQEIFETQLDQTMLTIEPGPTHLGGKVFFKNIVEFWPAQWVLSGIKLYPRDSRQSTLEVNGYEIISVLGAPLFINE